MKRLYFVRHGESTINAENKWGGQIDAPLNNRGKQQALKAAKKAKQEGLHFDLIISSPMIRTKQTAEIIANELGYEVTKIRYDKRLMERDLGELNGTPVDDFFAKYEYKDVDNVPGAETVEQMQQRAATAIKDIETLPEDNILIVSHSAFGRAFKRVLLNQPHAQEYDSPVVSLTHAEISLLERAKDA